MVKTILLVLLTAVVGFIAYVRLAPSDPLVWHIDPVSAPLPTIGGWLVRPDGGNATSPIWSGDTTATLAAFDAIAMATPRTTRLAGSVDEGRITYVTRSKLMGYPDYTTVTVAVVANGTALAIYARQRFGHGDQGVNRARVEAWLAQMPTTTARDNRLNP